MTTADLFSLARYDGLEFYIDTKGHLRGKGPTEVLDAWRTVIHEANDALVNYLTPRRLWLIHQDATGWVSHSFTPPASEAEVAAWYPDATLLPENAEVLP